MKIAIPVENGRLHSHFGGTTHFAVVEADSESKTTVRTEILPAPEHQPGAFPKWLRQQSVNVLIAGGIGRRALDIFEKQGIKVVAGSPGEPIEKLIESYLKGELATAPQGCEHHHHHHDHHHDHAHDHQHSSVIRID
jgi:ATP-binding protein involved in chromosome partitioning